MRGRIKVRVICAKIFFHEKMVLNDCLKIPKKPTDFISSSLRSMVVCVGFLQVKWCVGRCMNG